MREILFRGKLIHKEDYMLYEKLYKDNKDTIDVFNNGFVYGSLVVIKDKYYICIGVAGVLLNSLVNNTTATMIEVIPETVSQYTGLKDKNGNKIFEGDILKPDYDDNSYYRVVWDSTDLHFNLETYRFNNFAEKALLSWCENIANYGVEDDCKIIGNIYTEQSDTELTLNYWR